MTLTTVMGTSMSGHQSARMKSSSWLTPPDIVRALSKFDLDPCCPENMPWKTAETMLTEADDGLMAPWHGRVWLNPPFGREAKHWLEKLVRHGNGIALVPARTETQAWFDYIWKRASGILFLEGRPHFHRVDGTRAPFNSGAPIALIAYGEDNAIDLRCAMTLGLHGAFVLP